MTDKKNTAFSQQQGTQISIACERVQNAININNSTLAEQPSEELEDASKRYADNEEYGDDAYFAIKTAFKAGAHWQKEQILKSAIGAVIVNDETSGCVVDCEQGCLVLEPHTYPIGQKLKIIIVKEDKQ